MVSDWEFKGEKKKQEEEIASLLYERKFPLACLQNNVMKHSNKQQLKKNLTNK